MTYMNKKKTRPSRAAPSKINTITSVLKVDAKIQKFRVTAK